MSISKALRRPQVPATENASFDLSISDLMTGLLMLFILLLMGVLMTLQEQKEEYVTINEKAKNYLDLRNELYNELRLEFENEMDDWNAELDEDTLSFQFINSSDPSVGNVYFRPNVRSLEPVFEDVLDNFFPRFVSILYRPKFREFVSEIRIEGHAVNWANKYEYTYLVEYSQDRTNNVLKHVHKNPIVSESQRSWIESRIAANGFGASHPILREDGTIDDAKSRRVEFRVVTDAEQKIREIYQFREDEVGPEAL